MCSVKQWECRFSPGVSGNEQLSVCVCCSEALWPIEARNAAIANHCFTCPINRVGTVCILLASFRPSAGVCSRQHGFPCWVTTVLGYDVIGRWAVMKRLRAASVAGSLLFGCSCFLFLNWIFVIGTHPFANSLSFSGEISILLAKNDWKIHISSSQRYTTCGCCTATISIWTVKFYNEI